MDELDRVWLAAVIDSEGTMALTKRSEVKKRVKTNDEVIYTRYAAILSVVNTNYDFIDKCQRLMGTNEAKHKNGARLGRKPIWTIFLRNRQQILYVLKEIEPYLIIKRDLAKRLIEWLEWFQENRVIGTRNPGTVASLSITERNALRSEYDRMANYVREKMQTYDAIKNKQLQGELL